MDISYESDENDIVNEFYVPVLNNSSEYCRLVGYFNSSSLSLVSRGLKNFILNKSKMKIVCSADLNEDDVETIYNATYTTKEVIEDKFIKQLNEMGENPDSTFFNNSEVLGWMVAHDLLEIKVAVKTDSQGKVTTGGILHAKVGIFKDFDGNMISCTGSNNDTGGALLSNFEQFDIFSSWNNGDFQRVQKHLSTFDKYWDENIDSYDVMSVPTAVERKLINYAPKKLKI